MIPHGFLRLVARWSAFYGAASFAGVMIIDELHRQGVLDKGPPISWGIVSIGAITFGVFGWTDA